MSKTARPKKNAPEGEELSPLQVYLDKHGLSQEDFANKFDPKITQGLVWQWLEWLKNPKKGTRITAERAIEIEGLTNGEVPSKALRPDLFNKQARAA